MNFFRCQSHLYSYVQAVSNEQINCLTLRFSGSETLESTAVTFQLTEMVPESEDQEESKNETKLKGHFMNEDEEEVAVSVKVKGLTASNIHISPDSTAKCLKKNGASFTIRSIIYKTDWVLVKWLSAKNS